MSGDKEIVVGQVPYVMTILHALKYPACSVNGVLLGKAGKRQDGVAEVHVMEAVPLLHSHLALSPAMDGALCLIDEYSAEQGVGIVGYYHANAHHQHNELTPLAKRIADKIADTARENKKWVPMVCLVVDNEKLDLVASMLSSGQPCSKHTGVKVLSKAVGSTHWVNAQSYEILGSTDGSAQKLLHEHVMVGSQLELVDFDDHLNDTSKAWLRPIDSLGPVALKQSSDYADKYP